MADEAPSGGLDGVSSVFTPTHRRSRFGRAMKDQRRWIDRERRRRAADAAEARARAQVALARAKCLEQEAKALLDLADGLDALNREAGEDDSPPLPPPQR